MKPWTYRVPTGILSLVVLATAPLAASTKGKPPAAPFVPEIGYTYASGNYVDVRLANRDGSQAVLVSRNSGATQFDLSHRSARKVAYASNGRLAMRTWLTTSTGFSLGDEEVLFQATGGYPVNALDFSPTADKLLFTYDTSAGARLRVIDLSISGYPVLNDLPFAMAFSARWSSDGQRIIVHASRDSNAFPSMIVLNADGSEYSAFPGLFQDHPRFDSYRSANRDSFLISWGLTIYESDFVGNLTALTTGWEPHPDCRDTNIIFKKDDRRGRVVVIAPLTSPSSSQVWSSDKNIGFLDWMPGCPA